MCGAGAGSGPGRLEGHLLSCGGGGDDVATAERLSLERPSG